MTVKVICQVCGKVFFVYPYRANTAKVCSNKCHRKLQKIRAQSKTPNATCVICGRAFWDRYHRGGKYCSKECYVKSKTGRSPTKETREKMSRTRWKGGEVLCKKRRWVKEHVSHIRCRPIKPEELKQILAGD